MGSCVFTLYIARLLNLSHSQLEHSILELLSDNLKRLNEQEESDRQGAFHILGELYH
jgi:beta-catenin-like protein 1